MNDAIFRDTVTVTLPQGMHGQLIEAARIRGIVAGEFIRRALKNALTKEDLSGPDSDKGRGV